MNEGLLATISALIGRGGSLDSGPFYHSTIADLKIGDVLEPGDSSNYGERKSTTSI